jgi:hypothetical protein
MEKELGPRSDRPPRHGDQRITFRAVQVWRPSGRDMLNASSSHFDPKRSLGRTDRAMEAWYHPSIA